jgi:hypothetical protein
MATTATTFYPDIPSSRVWPSPGATLRRSWALNPPLTLLGVAMVLAVAATGIGLLIDPRFITGQPAWLKPAKFAISISIYAFTLVWLLSFVRGHTRLVGLVSWATAAALFIEMAVIVLQVARGTTSHFNVSTPLDATLWSTMGGFIVVVWVMAFLAGALLLIQRLPDPVFAWGLRLGLIIALIGMAAGLLMTSPTPRQVADARAGQGLPIAGAHSVGVPDGEPGLPLVGWSTTGGDLRVGHFVGLHALQVLPLVGWLLSRAAIARRIGLARGRGHRIALVGTAGLAYAGLVALALWQALRGQSLIAPDAATLLALVGVLTATGLTALAIVLHGRRWSAARARTLPA